MLKPPRYYNFITSDIDMPIMDGKTAAKEIRDYEISHMLKPVRIIFIIGNSTQT